MSERTFEFCALKYLLLWGQQEKEIHEGMSVAKGRPEVSALRKALKHFRIARNFPNIEKVENANLVIDCLLEIRRDDARFPEQKVQQLAERFKETFGQRNLSAASKLLWFRHRSPFLIFDRHASVALKMSKNSDYLKYVEAWKESYRTNHDKIHQAADRLPEVSRFLRDWYQLNLSEKEIEFLASQSWFQERIFDIYLWELGGNEQPVSQ